MGIDLTKLKENELKKFSYEDTLKVVDELETTGISQFAGIDAVEKSEQYYSFANIIKNRIENDEFAELKFKNKKNDKEILQHRIITMLSNFKYSLDLGKLEKRIKEVEPLVSKISNLELDYNNKKKEIESSLKNYETRINESEHKILTHVLTLLGIFTAIITVVMSVTITSNSWLNNADTSSALIAFIVPNLVTLLAVVVLMSFIVLYNSRNDYENSSLSESETKKKSKEENKEIIKLLKKSSRFYIARFVIIFVMILSALLSALSLLQSHSQFPTHIRYIIPSTQYEIVEDSDESVNQCSHTTDCYCHESSQIKVYCEFTFEDKLYRFEYDESLKHGENLYFCEKHCVLE